VSLAVAGGCGSPTPGGETVDGSVRHHLLIGVARIRATHDRTKLHAELTRVLAAALSELWGQQVIVENRSGAGNTIACSLKKHATMKRAPTIAPSRAPNVPALR